MIKCKYQKGLNRKVPDVVLYSDVTENAPMLAIKYNAKGEVTFISKNIGEECGMILSHPKNPLANDIIGFLYNLAYHWKHNKSMHFEFGKANLQISDPEKFIPESPVFTSGRDVALKIYNEKNNDEYISITYDNSAKEVEIKTSRMRITEFTLSANGPYAKSSINGLIRNLQLSLARNPISTQNRNKIEL